MATHVRKVKRRGVPGPLGWALIVALMTSTRKHYCYRTIEAKTHIESANKEEHDGWERNFHCLVQSVNLMLLWFFKDPNPPAQGSLNIRRSPHVESRTFNTCPNKSGTNLTFCDNLFTFHNIYVLCLLADFGFGTS
jgi:hypothetical protein